MLHANNITNQLCMDYEIFADDIKLYACVGFFSLPALPPPSSVTKVQFDIDALPSAASSWGLNMTAKNVLKFTFKTEHMFETQSDLRLAATSGSYDEHNFGSHH